MLLRILKSKFIGFKLNLILLLIIRYICEAQAFFFMPKKAFWEKIKLRFKDIKKFFQSLRLLIARRVKNFSLYFFI